MTLLTTLHQKTAAAGTRVILLRHGQSTYNAAKRHQGCCDDSVLTATGRLTAYQSGLLLRQLNLNTCYVSPLQRAQETAQEVLAAIATATDQPPEVIVHPALREVSLPLWEGLPYQVVREQFAVEYRRWKEQPDRFQMMLQSEELQTARESPISARVIQHHYPLLDLYDRAHQFWREILPYYDGETLLVVAHSGTIRALISTALGIAPSYFHRLQQSNCGISVLQFPKIWEQPTCLEVMNSTAHLGEALPKLKEGKQGLRLLVVPAEGETTRTQALAQRLNAVEIDFCLCDDRQRSQQAVKQLLPAPNRVQTSVVSEESLRAWHQVLLAQRPARPAVGAITERPWTALIVAHPAIALQLISQMLGVRFQHLHLIPDTLSVIHYPQTLNNPVLQAMNLD
jgi:probable phosphoglycerate mutase